MDNFTEIIGFIEASMMRLFLLSDRGLTKSSVSKLFESCTIRHIAMSVEMTYVHTDIVRKRPPQLTF